MNESWIFEKHTEDYGVSWKTTNILHREKSNYQEIAIADSATWGKMLLLDGIVQTTENDEFMYHEMIVQVVMHAHPGIKKVLVIGGGDGGTLNQLVKHQAVEQIDLVEIDGQVIAICQKYFPGFQAGFSDPRSNIIIQDGIEYVQKTDKKYDLVIVDSSDPTGPAVGLFTSSFYANIFKILNDDGMMVTQSESPVFYADIFSSIYKNISSVFGQAHIYTSTVPTYISGPWTFTIGSKKYDPRIISPDRPVIAGMKYYSPAIHQAAFILPEYIKNQLISSNSPA